MALHLTIPTRAYSPVPDVGGTSLTDCASGVTPGGFPRFSPSRNAPDPRGSDYDQPTLDPPWGDILRAGPHQGEGVIVPPAGKRPCGGGTRLQRLEWQMPGEAERRLLDSGRTPAAWTRDFHTWLPNIHDP